MATTISIELTCEDSGQTPEYYGFDGSETAEEIIAFMKQDRFSAVVEDYGLVDNAKIRVEVFKDGQRTTAEWDAWEKR